MNVFALIRSKQAVLVKVSNYKKIDDEHFPVLILSFSSFCR